MLLQEKDPRPYKSLKENGISHAKIDGCKMHMTVMFIGRLEKALGYLEYTPNSVSDQVLFW